MTKSVPVVYCIVHPPLLAPISMMESRIKTAFFNVAYFCRTSFDEFNIKCLTGLKFEAKPSVKL